MSRSSSRVAAFLLSLAALAVVPAATRFAVAQDEPERLPPIVDEIQVEVVNVDVVVSDGDGRRISDLTAEDFVLYEDGKERKITNFYAFKEGLAREAAAPADEGARKDAWPDPVTRRRMALLFDDNTLDKRDRKRAIEDLERFILEQFDGTYEWAVIAYSDHLQLMQPFTDDKTTVLSALARVRDLPVLVRQARATDPTFSEHPLVVAGLANIGGRVGGQALDQPGPRGLSTLDFEVRERMFEGLQRFDRTAAALVETMRAYTALPGRKSLVLVSGALDTVPGGAQLIGYGLPALGGGERNDPMIALLNTEVQRRLEVIVKTANAAGFAIYPISSEGLLRGKAPYLDVGRDTNLLNTAGDLNVSAEIETETAPRVIATGTGGKFFSSTRFYRAYDEIDDRTANAYVLGFATDHDPDRKYHKIEVKAKRPGVKIQHREGYLHLTREDRLIEELSTPLAFPKDRGDFAVALEVMTPEEVGKKSVRVTVAGTVPLTEVTLIPQGDQMVGTMYLYLALYDREGKLVKLFRERQDVQLPATKVSAAAPDAPARFGLTLDELERGEYTMTLTLVDEFSDRYGTGLQMVSL